jgi:hypothetical protein
MVGMPRRRGDRTSCGDHRMEFAAGMLVSWARNVYTLTSSLGLSAERDATRRRGAGFDLDFDFGAAQRRCGRDVFLRGGAEAGARSATGGSDYAARRPEPPGRARAKRGSARPPAWNDTDRGRSWWTGGPERSERPDPRVSAAWREAERKMR